MIPSEQLKRAFAEAARLSETEQDAIAAWLLEELASDRRWTETFANSIQTLESLADEALSEHRAGRSQPLDPNNL